MDDQVDVTKPEALVYELDANGEITGLVAHENIFYQHPTQPLWVLHAWLWKDNSTGAFQDWDPAVRQCRATRNDLHDIAMATRHPGCSPESPGRPRRYTLGTARANPAEPTDGAGVTSTETRCRCSHRLVNGTRATQRSEHRSGSLLVLSSTDTPPVHRPARRWKTPEPKPSDRRTASRSTPASRLAQPRRGTMTNHHAAPPRRSAFPREAVRSRASARRSRPTCSAARRTTTFRSPSRLGGTASAEAVAGLRQRQRHLRVGMFRHTITMIPPRPRGGGGRMVAPCPSPPHPIRSHRSPSR